ncbi:hypothetical protein C8Q74DRAFT_1248781 [Fomes fomentarius]|nr:hypothetical protein C8Q74DRAFT_1248781 [Fomes fomentarius]
MSNSKSNNIDPASFQGFVSSNDFNNFEPFNRSEMEGLRSSMGFGNGPQPPPSSFGWPGRNQIPQFPGSSFPNSPFQNFPFQPSFQGSPPQGFPFPAAQGSTFQGGSNIHGQQAPGPSYPAATSGSTKASGTSSDYAGTYADEPEATNHASGTVEHSEGRHSGKICIPCLCCCIPCCCKVSFSSHAETTTHTYEGPIQNSNAPRMEPQSHPYAESNPPPPYK